MSKLTKESEKGLSRGLWRNLRAAITSRLTRSFGKDIEAPQRRNDEAILGTPYHSRTCGSWCICPDPNHRSAGRYCQRHIRRGPAQNSGPGDQQGHRTHADDRDELDRLLFSALITARA